MEKSKIDQFLAAFGGNFPEEAQMEIRERLEAAEDSKFDEIMALSPKSGMTMALIAWFGGFLGLDRFMMGDTGLGIAKLCTCGGCGIWTIIDIFTASGRAKKFNLGKLNEII